MGFNSSISSLHNSPPTTPSDSPKVNSAVGFNAIVGFNVSAATQKQFTATLVANSAASSTSTVRSVSPFLDHILGRNPESSKTETNPRSPSPLVTKSQPTLPELTGNDRLYSAMSSGQIREVQTLVKQGNVHLLQEVGKGVTFLTLAISSKAYAIAEILLEAEPKLIYTANVRFNRTPLHIAAGLGSTDFVTLLLKYSPKLNATDIQGNTPLHLASRTGSVPIYNMLVKAGARTSITNKRGETAKRPQSSASQPMPIKDAATENQSEHMMFPMTWLPPSSSTTNPQ